MTWANEIKLLFGLLPGRDGQAPARMELSMEDYELPTFARPSPVTPPPRPSPFPSPQSSSCSPASTPPKTKTSPPSTPAQPPTTSLPFAPNVASQPQPTQSPQSSQSNNHCNI
jgi:hypothetical protein